MTSTRCGCWPSTGRWYLEAWCHRAEAVRLFRLDRVLSARVLDGVDGTPPPEAVSRDLDDGLFTPAPTTSVVVLDLAPRAALGRRVLPDRGRSGAARRRPASAAAHVRPVLAAPARAAPAGWCGARAGAGAEVVRAARGRSGAATRALRAPYALR